MEGKLDLETQLLRYLDQGLTPDEAVGRLILYTGNVPYWNLEKNWYKLDEEEAARLYLYRSFSSTKDYAIEDELRGGAASHLGLSEVVTENTIGKISDEVEAKIGTDAFIGAYWDGAAAIETVDHPATYDFVGTLGIDEYREHPALTISGHRVTG